MDANRLAHRADHLLTLLLSSGGQSGIRKADMFDNRRGSKPERAGLAVIVAYRDDSVKLFGR